MDYLAVVKGDWNDCDYVYTISEVSEKEANDLEKIYGLVDKYKKLFGMHTYSEVIYLVKEISTQYLKEEYVVDKSNQELVNEEELELLGWFDGYFMPWGYEQDCHSLESIDIYPISKGIKVEESRELYEKAYNTWGLPAQMRVVTEECAELIVAISHWERRRISVEEFLSEVADVMIMCEQMAWMFGEEKFEVIKQAKLERLKSKLNDSN